MPEHRVETQEIAALIAMEKLLPRSALTSRGGAASRPRRGCRSPRFVRVWFRLGAGGE